MQIVENWSEITGTILATETSIKPKNYNAMTIAVEAIEPVEDYPELISQMVEQEANVYINSDLYESLRLRPGTLIRSRVRLGNTGRLFVHPQHIEVLEQDVE